MALRLALQRRPRITNINHLTKLKKLYACDGSGIDDQGIKDLIELEILYVDSNKKITNINHLTKLKILSAIRESGIDDQGIKDLIEL